ncbi:MAG: NADH-quinone oxidoreductase subunit L [Verrucomicrobiales bacterium]|nr:NADH-quinone oxidoreductase subunit L [Verrucomicrobiales bacterium]
MHAIATHIWLIPLLPLLAAGVVALLPKRASTAAIGLATGSMGLALVLSLAAFLATLGGHADGAAHATHIGNFDWFRLGTGSVRLGFLLDPLGAVMLVMVSFVGLLIFIFSIGYMAHDPNRTRFFCFLALFASAMLGVVVANSLLLLFACWEVMGVASYLLIGFWYHKPSAAVAAKKAFLVTRIGDIGLFLGMLWMYHATGTLLFFDDGRGCLEADALTQLGGTAVRGGLTAATGIALLLLVGAIGKSGQVPLHVWLPDAMEGPTPVSALIHAATMVAAGVFLVARVFPLMTGGVDTPVGEGTSVALQAVAGVGALTAVFAACLAVAQQDIKRILAYSTVSQLGYMFLGLGTGGVAVGMFHLITHAFFKALLFLGAGSVIHGCHEQQDIRWMGGLRRLMPVTYATYAVGMMALAGVPLFFSGFWSKDEILHAAWSWAPSRWPFVLGVVGAFLTAFYMTRQMAEVFFGQYRGGVRPHVGHGIPEATHGGTAGGVHESPGVMTVPLVLLAGSTLVLGWLGTPAWPWFEAYLNGHSAHLDFGRLAAAWPMMLVSVVVVALGIGTGWWVYGRRSRVGATAPDPLESQFPRIFRGLQARLYVDELYDATVVRLHHVVSMVCGWMDELVLGGLVTLVGLGSRLAAFSARSLDELLVNLGFDAGCASTRWGGRGFSWLQNGSAQRYLGGLGLGLATLAILVLWGWRHG